MPPAPSTVAIGARPTGQPVGQVSVTGVCHVRRCWTTGAHHRTLGRAPVLLDGTVREQLDVAFGAPRSSPVADDTTAAGREVGAATHLFDARRLSSGI